jgi:hypothetical protein
MKGEKMPKRISGLLWIMIFATHCFSQTTHCDPTSTIVCEVSGKIVSASSAHLTKPRLFMKGLNYGAISSAGDTVLKPEFQKIHFLGCERLAANFNPENYLDTIDPHQWIITDYAGKQLAGPFYAIRTTAVPALFWKNQEVGPSSKNSCFTNPVFNRGMLAVKVKNEQIGERWGCIDTNGKFVIPAEYRFVEDHGDPVIYVGGPDGLNLLDRTTFKPVLPSGFSEICYFTQGLAAVLRADGWGFIDYKGKMVIPAKYNRAFPFYNDEAMVIKKKDTLFIGLDGKIRSKGATRKTEAFMIYENFIKVKERGVNQGDYALYDRTTGKRLSEPIMFDDTYKHSPFFVSYGSVRFTKICRNDANRYEFNGGCYEAWVKLDQQFNIDSSQKIDSLWYEDGIIQTFNLTSQVYDTITLADSAAGIPFRTNSTYMATSAFIDTSGRTIVNDSCYCGRIEKGFVTYKKRDDCIQETRKALAESRLVEFEHQRAKESKKKWRKEHSSQKLAQEILEREAAARSAGSSQSSVPAGACAYCKGTGILGGGLGTCTACNGTGGSNCSRCGGSGWIAVTSSNGKSSSHNCSACGGSGKNKCYCCYGTGKRSLGGTTCPHCGGTGSKK